MTAPSPSTIVELAEWGSAEVDCSADIAAQMHASRHVNVHPLTGGRYEVRAKRKVGVLRYGPMEVRITPKVPVSRLLHLALHADLGDRDLWRNEEAMLDAAPDALSAIAHALAFAVERAIRPTPAQGYVTHDEALHGLRGRLSFERQIGGRAGLAMPVEVRFDEYELGIVENRILAAALDVVGAAMATEGTMVARRISHLRSMLAEVRPWPRGVRLPEVHFTRLNERYRAAIALARLVLDGRSLEFPQRTHRGTAFLLDMDRVFEAYVSGVLKAELERHGGAVRSQHTTHLDERDTIAIRPDITWWQHGSCVAVLDAKYKRTTIDEFPNADAYQMLAYCTRLELKRGWLLYADLDGVERRPTVVRGAGIEIVVRQLPIAGPLAQLREQAASLAADIVATTMAPAV